MFSTSEMSSSARTLFSAYASFAASMMLVRSMANEIIPAPLRSYLRSAVSFFFAPLLATQITIVIDQHCGMLQNEVYEAAEIYLNTKISPNTQRFKVGKIPRQKNLTVSMEVGQEISERFQNIQLKWKYVASGYKNDRSEEQRHSKYPTNTQIGHSKEQGLFELSFDKKFKEIVMDDYLPFFLAKSNEIKDADKVMKLKTRDCSINLEHPSTFETLAMDPDMKKLIIEDLERFARRRDYYKKVGKAWKRGYLLYGPPGTGKSSLIAAMANYLKFDIYDLELASFYSNSELRRILLSTKNRSIIVIEDIDCSVNMRDRQSESKKERSEREVTELF